MGGHRELLHGTTDLNRHGEQPVQQCLFANTFQDMFVIATSSCSRMLPSKRGYSRVNGGIANNGGRRGRHDSEDENRLIDQLDEEWED